MNSNFIEVTLIVNVPLCLLIGFSVWAAIMLPLISALIPEKKSTEKTNNEIYFEKYPPTRYIAPEPVLSEPKVF